MCKCVHYALVKEVGEAVNMDTLIQQEQEPGSFLKKGWGWVRGHVVMNMPTLLQGHCYGLKVCVLPKFLC